MAVELRFSPKALARQPAGWRKPCMGLNHDDLLRLLILVVNVASLEKAVFVYSKQVERFVRIQHSFP